MALPALVIIALGLYLWLGPGRRTDWIDWRGTTMGTTFSIRAHVRPLGTTRLKALRADVDRALDEVNRQMSTYRADSEISAFNRAAPDSPVPVSAAFAEVCALAMDIASASGGAFDPTIGPLVRLWGFGPTPAVIEMPNAESIAAARARVGYTNVLVGPGPTLLKRMPDVELDLGAIAKGYGVDAAARVLTEAGVTDFFVEVGGEVLAHGTNPRGEPWRIGVDRPDYDAVPGAHLEAILALSNAAVATSGDYRNYWIDDQDRVRAHIIDPATGEPVAHALASVSVVASNCTLADALATTLFVLGPERAPEWLKAHYPDTEALLLIREGTHTYREVLTEGFAARTAYRPPQPDAR